MLDLGTLKIGVEVDDSKAKGKLDNLGSEADKTGGRFDKFKAGLVKVGVGIAAVSAAAILVGKKIKNLTDSVARYGDEIDKNSQKMGITSKAYQEWDYVLQRNGSSINALKTGMKTFTAQIESGGKAFDTLGVKTKNADGSFRDTTDILNDSITALAGVKDATERTALANELFGKRTAQELLPTLNSGADGIEELKKRAEELGFVMSDDTVKACAEYEDAMLDVKNSLTGLKNNIFAPLIPLITQIAQGFANTVGTLSKAIHNSEAYQKAIDKVSKSLKTMSKWLKSHKTLVKVVATTILAIVGAIKTWQTVTKAIAAAQTLLNVVLSANPIGLVVVAIAALVAAFVTAYKNSEKFRKVVDKVWSTIKSGVETVVKKITDFGEKVKKVFEFVGNLFGGLKDAWDNILHQDGEKEYKVTPIQFDEVVEKAKAVFNQWKDNLAQTASKAYTTVKEGFESFIDGAKEVFNQWKTNLGQTASKAFSVAKQGFEAFVTSAVEVFNQWKTNLSQTASKAFTVTKQGFENFVTAAVDVFNKWKNVVGQAGSKTFQVVKQGLEQFSTAALDVFNKWKNVVGQVGSKTYKVVKDGLEAFSNAAKNVFDKWKSVLTQGASKTYKVVKDGLEAFSNAAKDVYDKWKSVLGQTASKTFKVVKDGFEKAADAAKSVFDNWKNVLGQTASKTLKTSTSGMSDAAKAIKKVHDNWADTLKQTASKAFKATTSGMSDAAKAIKKVHDNWAGVLKQKAKKTFTTVYETIKKTITSGKKKKRIGLKEVPYDGYEAELHKGETILTAAETNQYRKWLDNQEKLKAATAQPMTQAMEIDYDRLASTMFNALSGMNINTEVNVNGRAIAQATAPFMKTEINTLDRRANRALGVV